MRRATRKTPAMASRDRDLSLPATTSSPRVGDAGSAAAPRDAPSSISACRRCARASSHADEVDQMEPYFPLHVLVCDELLPGAAAGVREPGAHLHRVRLFLVLLDAAGSSTRRRYCEMITGAARARPGQPGVSSSPATTAICCSTSCRSACRCSGIEPAANVAEVARREGRPDAASSSSASSSRDRLVARGQAAPTSSSATTCWRRCRTSTTSSPAWRACWRPRASITLEFPHLERLIAENQFDTIYHEHFSYFSLVTIDRLAERHGLKLIDVEELPTHGGSLRVYLAHAGSAHAGSPTRAGAARARERAWASTTSTTYARFAEQVRRDQAQAAVVPDRGQGAGQAHLRLRRAGQGQHAAQLLRHRHRLPRLHRRPQPLQARPLHAGHAHPDPARSRRSTRPGPTTSSSCPGT